MSEIAEQRAGREQEVSEAAFLDAAGKSLTPFLSPHPMNDLITPPAFALASAAPELKGNIATLPLPTAPPAIVKTRVRPLSGPERKMLDGWEAVIRQGWEGFVEVGLALAGIRGGRLFRCEF